MLENEYKWFLIIRTVMRQILFEPMPLIKCKLQYTALIVHAILKLT